MTSRICVSLMALITYLSYWFLTASFNPPPKDREWTYCVCIVARGCACEIGLGDHFPVQMLLIVCELRSASSPLGYRNVML